MTATVRSKDAEQMMPPATATHVVDLEQGVRQCTERAGTWRPTACGLEFDECDASSYLD
jgi:hypothetical protein